MQNHLFSRLLVLVTLVKLETTCPQIQCSITLIFNVTHMTVPYIL